MDEAVERMTAELADELASSEPRVQDTKSMPVRFHNLRAVAVSPAHGLASFRTFASSLAMRLGSGTHALVTGSAPVVCLPSHIKQRRGKAYDAWRAEQPAKTIVLSHKEYEHAVAMSASIRGHEIASNILFGPGTVLEQTLRWEQLGRTRQSTPDARGPYHVAEIKTGRCVEPGKFVRDGGFRSYHVQLADQCAAIEAVTGKWPEESYIVAVESVPPYVVTVFQVTDHTLVKGRRLAELWLAKLISCERSGEWPAYSTGIEVFDIPDDGLDLAYDTELDTPAWKRGAEPGADE